MRNLAKNSMSYEAAKEFIIGLCGNDTFGKQMHDECVFELNNIGYHEYTGVLGARKITFVNDYTERTLTNAYRNILRSYE